MTKLVLNVTLNQVKNVIELNDKTRYKCNIKPSNQVAIILKISSFIGLLIKSGIRF